MYSSVTTAVLHGLDAVLVKVEADVSAGLPCFEMVGFLAAEVKEAKERVRTALKNCGYQLPAKKITISFSPAGIRKSGSGFDLAVAVAILSALGVVPAKRAERMVFLGELNLSGQVVPVPGVLPILVRAGEEGYSTSMVSAGNRREAALVPGMEHICIGHLEQAVAYLRDQIMDVSKEETCKNPVRPEGLTGAETIQTGNISRVKREEPPDFSEISGQKLLKRACEIAVAGRHNLLMIGPPGAGKTMAAKRIPTILPPMTDRERLEVSKIYSICGLFDETYGLMGERPFRSPHHTITPRGLAGGGGNPRPGEISLAHKGVLFLDELTEFKASALEILRQPMEERQIQIVRSQGKYTFPADFMLVAAMNPCNCGYYPDMQKCRCSEADIRRYQNRISQPLLDRMDLCIKINKIPYEELYSRTEEETSAQIRERVIQAHSRQEDRYRKKSFRYNSQIPAKEISLICRLDAKQEKMMRHFYQSLGLSVRTYHKVLKTARTIADLEGSERILTEHLQEALCYRSIDRSFWEVER